MNKIQIIETNNIANELYSKLENKEVFVQFIYDDINRHSLFNKFSAVYLNDFENEYLINISNCDAKKVNITDLNLNFTLYNNVVKDFVYIHQNVNYFI